MKEILSNDKNLVIFCVTLLASFAMFIMGIDSKEIVTNSISGLMGVAVGKALQ